MADYILYRGDFRRLTAKHIADNSVHLVFVDPPYGGQYLDLWNPLAALAARVLRPGGLLVTYSGQYHLPRVIHDLSLNLRFVWMDSLYTPKANSLARPVRVKSRWKPLLVFVKDKYEVMCSPECKQDCRVDTDKTRKRGGKTVPVRRTNFDDCEHPCHRLHDTRWWRYDTFESEPPDKSQHPKEWTQSQAEAEHYIDLFTLPGDTVLDPMVGTGTTMLAALKLGRNAIGVDIDKALIDEVAEPRVRELYG